MKNMIRRVKSSQRQWVLLVSAVCIAGCSSGSGQGNWLQWGGPNRNFVVEAKGLADSWPEAGPNKLWHRELGDGYSAIVSDGKALFTMYRIDQDEFTIALSSETGETLWEHKQASPTTDLMEQFGAGPHSTPVLVGNRLFTIGSNAVFYCFDKNTGTVLWSHDLAEEFGAPIPGRGYGVSPIAYKNAIIVPVDRTRPSGDDAEEESTEQVEGQSLFAFDQGTGKVVWKAQDYRIGYSSPILINFLGEEQLVQLLADGIMGVNPQNGDLLWHLALEPQGANIATPVWNGKDLLFCSSAYDSGSRVVKLTKKGDETVAEQLWYSRKVRIHHGNAIPIGDYLYASSGDFGPAFFASMNAKTGKVAWRERGFKKATCVYADNKMIILDEDGQLALASVSPEGLTVHSKCKIAERYAWAVPTLVGKILYVRDRKHIMALDLG